MHASDRDKKRQAVRDCLANNPALSEREIATQCGVSWDMVSAEKKRSGMKASKTTLPLSLLKSDPRLQMRVETSQEYIDELAEWLKENPDDELPPVVVFEDAEGNAWVADGHGHRLPAYHLAGRERIPVKVQKGTFREAWLYALQANEDHGLRRCGNDKRKSVNAALDDVELAKLPDAELARAVKVHRAFVAQVKKERAGLVPVRDGSSRTVVANQLGSAELGDESATSSAPQADTGAAPAPRRQGPFLRAGSKQCVDCDKSFDRQVWCCTSCKKHVLAVDRTCWNCGTACHLPEAYFTEQPIPLDEGEPVPPTERARTSAPAPAAKPKLHKPDDAVRDHFGREVPPQLAEAFETVPQYRSLIHRIGELKTAVLDLKGDGLPGSELLRIDAVNVDLSNAQSGLRFATPYAVCPECSGNGIARITCKLCVGRGWIDESCFGRLSAETKAKCEHKADVA